MIQEKMEYLAMIKAMQVYGGSFVRALAECFMRADAENFQRLLLAFPEYVEQYKGFAQHMDKGTDE